MARLTDRLVIAVGLNENVSRAQDPAVPITPDEIAADVAECVEAGATVIHLHARDPITGEPVMDDPVRYLEVFRAVRERTPDALVYPTYPNGETEARYRHVRALMEAGLLEIAPVIAGSADLTPGPDLMAQRLGGDWLLHQPLGDVVHQLDLARRHDLWVSHDIMEPGGVRQSAILYRLGLYVRPVLYKFFMSEQWGFGFPPEPRFLDVYASTIPDDVEAEWLVLPYGCRWEVADALWQRAIETGGHVRVGVGDNPGGSGGGPWRRTNAERVAEMAERGRRAGRPPATIADVRARFAPLAAAVGG
jgi:3-keto-5-aminohexanoate cleavage enzyme